MRTGTGPQGMDRALGARVVSPQRGSHSRGLGCHEGGTDAFMTDRSILKVNLRIDFLQKNHHHRVNDV